MTDYKMMMEFFNRRNTFDQTIGFEVTEMGDGWARGRIELKPELLNIINSLHGGVLCSLADSISGVAAYSSGYYMTTMSMDLHFLNPAWKTKYVYAYAHAIKRGHNTWVLDSELTSDEGQLLVKATATYFNMGIPFPDEEA